MQRRCSFTLPDNRHISREERYSCGLTSTNRRRLSHILPSANTTPRVRQPLRYNRAGGWSSSVFRTVYLTLAKRGVPGSRERYTRASKSHHAFDCIQQEEGSASVDPASKEPEKWVDYPRGFYRSLGLCHLWLSHIHGGDKRSSLVRFICTARPSMGLMSVRVDSLLSREVRFLSSSFQSRT